ncbi:transposase [Streptomyces sp. NPDC127033]|uniref:transposase n=1 Tax=Streptomyces sp. NPDC127033 TaxID=3347110 RepID=UPI003651368C
MTARRPRACPQCRLVVSPFVVRRHEVTDQAWAVIGPLLAPPRMGRPVRDRRQVLNGILWKLSTKCGLAGPAGTVWVVEDGLRTVPALVGGRDLGPAPGSRPAAL